jgi:rubrerythrin
MMIEPIRSVEEFFAHAIAIEFEAAARYREFEGYFTDRGEAVLAGLCGNLAHFEEEHFDELLRRSQGLSLPKLSPEQYRWINARSPEEPSRELFYEVATARQLLQVALRAERDARRFFEYVAGTTTSPEVQAMAEEMAREEDDHVRWVSKAMEYLPQDGVDWERLLAAGGGPGLALGEERRLRRREGPGK